MLILALDTATVATSVAIVAVTDGAHALAQDRVVDPRAHGERLAPMVARLLAQVGAQPDQLAAIVAGDGPGPFTGLRVGLATAAAMGQALGVPTYGVCSLDGIGAAAGPEQTLVATDARRREIYWAVYAGGERLTEPAVDRPAEVVPLLADRGVRRAMGEGARRYRYVLGLPVAEEPSYPEPVALVARAYQRIVTGAPGERLTPRYLRRPDAAQPRPPKPVTGR